MRTYQVKLNGKAYYFEAQNNETAVRILYRLKLTMQLIGDKNVSGAVLVMHDQRQQNGLVLRENGLNQRKAA